MAAGMSRREPLFDPEAVFTLPATPSSQQIPCLRMPVRRVFRVLPGITLSRSWT